MRFVASISNGKGKNMIFRPEDLVLSATLHELMNDGTVLREALPQATTDQRIGEALEFFSMSQGQKRKLCLTLIGNKGTIRLFMGDGKLCFSADKK